MNGHETNILFIPGWGTTAGIFDPLIDELNRLFAADNLRSRFTAELNCWTAPERLESSAAAEKRSILVGWSLGAQQGLSHVIKHREKYRGLVLISGTPRLTEAENWEGADQETLSGMIDQLNDRRSAVLTRFFNLSILPRRNPALCRRLKENSEQFKSTELTEGLKALSRTDLRSRLGSLKSDHAPLPVLLLHGQQDKVVPWKHSLYLASGLNSRTLWFKEGSHLLPLTHSGEIAKVIKEFVYDCK